MLRLISLIFVILYVVQGSVIKEPKPRMTLGRVVNGTDAADGDYPYMVSLRRNASLGSSFCGGSLLNNEWVLTAAHCLDSVGAIKVVIGVTDFLYETENDFFEVDKLIIHPDYDYWSIDYDFGLVHLAEPIEFTDKIQPIKLVEQDLHVEAGTWGVFSGWGMIDNATISFPTRLQRADLVVFDFDECIKIHEPLEYDVTERMLCATYPGGGVDQCSGDSGGPFVVDGVQIGTSSWSVKPCGRPDFPGVMGRVSSVRNWIDENTSI